MHSRKIGPFEVSAVGLGCMNCSMGYGAADDKISLRLLNQALDSGYRFLDTASVYGEGHNESLIGRALKHRRGEYVLASKCGLIKRDGQSVPHGEPGFLKQQCEDSLRRLQTDVIDIYYLHRIDPKLPIEDSVGALTDLVHAGKIRCIGLSEISSVSLRRAHAVFPVTAVQSEYSLWSRTPESGMLQACEELQVSFVPFSPLGRGFLTGKAQDVTQLDPDDLRCSIARPRFEADNFARNRRLLEPFSRIAGRHDCTMGQLALAWLLAQKNSAGDKTLVPIPGTRHIDHMQENARAADIKLDDTTIDELDRLINEDSVAGQRYSRKLMLAIDSERDRG